MPHLRRTPLRRRGSTYVFVLLTALVVAAMAVGGLAARRAIHDRTALADEAAQSRLGARTALEMGVQALETHTNPANEFKDKPVFEATFQGATLSATLSDPVDGDLTNNDTDPIQITGLYSTDTARARLAGTLLPAIAAIGSPKDLEPTAYWPMTESAGDTVLHESCMSLDGTYEGTNTAGRLSASSGGPAPCYLYKTQYGLVPHNAALESSGTTIATKVYLAYTKSLSARAVFAKGSVSSSRVGDIRVFIDTDGTPYAYFGDGSTRHVLRGDTTLTGTTWHHIAVTMGLNGITLYLDGVRIAESRGHTFGTAANKYDLYFGVIPTDYKGTTKSSLTGATLDGVYFNRQLNDNEVAALAGLTPNAKIELASLRWVVD